MSTTESRDWRRLLPVGRQGWLLRRPGFTAAEVRRLVREPTGSPRGQAVQRCLARPGDWLGSPLDLAECPTRYQQLLPRIVFWYARGEECSAIAMRMRGLESTWGVERALLVACALMAACLNRDPDGYGLPR